MGVKEKVRLGVQLAYASPGNNATSKHRVSALPEWVFDATVVVLLVVFGTLYFVG